MKKLLIIPFLLITLLAFSQYKPKKTGGLYRTGQDKIDKGWYFGIGTTYMLGYNTEKVTITTADTLNNVYDNKYFGDPKGKFGLFGVNVGYRFDQSEKFFYVNGLGLNLDYAIIKGRTPTPSIPNLSYTDGPGTILGEMHYFFGMGFKTGKRLIIMPMIETPIFAIYPFKHIISTHPYFNSRARPFIIKIRFMLLKKGSKSCPAVYNPMGIDPNNNLEK